MKLSHSMLALLCLVTAALFGADWAASEAARQEKLEPPSDWIDPATGHRVIRLSKDPGTSSFYFHQQSYTEKGDKIVVSAKKGLATIDISKLGTSPPTVEQITQGKGGGNVIVGKKSRQVYYITGGSLWATHVDTKESRELAKLPKGFGQSSGLALNADETLVASTANDPEAKEKANKNSPGSSDFFPPGGLPKGTTLVPGGKSLVLFTVNTKTGELKKIHYSTDWLNHTQFSPTDPEQILFCHEGSWDYVNRVRTIRADGTGEKLMHPRTMVNEIAGHEFFSFDGQMVWYDLQTPRSGVFWLAGVNIKTGERIRYPIERNQWSVHYNQSHDGKLFSGDGGGPNSVANRAPKGAKPLDGPGNGQWMYLFVPEKDKFETIKVGGEDVKIGKFKAEKLVDMSKHNYNTKAGGTEPNGTFTPDNKWVVFRSNIHGAMHVYAVEVAKPQPAKAEQSADWIDPTTGHRVIRLSGPGGGGSLYFHQNTYTPEGDKLIFNSKGAIVAVDLTTLGVKPPQVEVVLQGASAIAMARKTREVYFSKGKGGGVYAVHVDTHAVREVKNAVGGCINADETFSVVAKNATDPTGNTPKPEPRKLLPQKERMFSDKLKMGIALTPEEERAALKEDGLAKRLINPACQAFVFTNLKTGEAKTVGYQYAWLNHLQFSPTDPNMLLYCHEGTWHELDRVWTIRTDGSAMKLMHKRTMDMEIAGHEFWSFDGKTVWFDLQTPRSKEFWLAGVGIDTGDKIRYKIDRDQWSVHYNVSRDGKLFAGDGGDPGQVAYAKDGQWIYAFTPELGDAPVKDGWRQGTFKAEKLVNMAKHNYKTEPNVTITPDGKWVVFRSNLQGPSHVYAVEVKKSK